MIEFACPYCSKTLKTKDDKAGLSATCPGCSAELTVPQQSPSTAVVDEPEVVETAGATRACPMCGEQVPVKATKCRFCGEQISDKKSRRILAPHRGVLILVLGLLSWLVCPFVGVAAWFMGTHDLQEMDAGRMDDEGRALTQAGRIIGLIFLILGVVSLLIVGGLFAIALVGAAAGAN